MAGSKEGGPRTGSALPEAGFKPQLRGPGKGKGESLNLALGTLGASVGVMSARLDFRGSGDGPASRIKPRHL